MVLSCGVYFPLVCHLDNSIPYDGRVVATAQCLDDLQAASLKVAGGKEVDNNL